MIIEAFNNDDRWWGRLLNSAAHWMIYLLPVGLIANIGNDILIWSMPKTGWSAAWFAVAGIAMVMSYANTLLIVVYLLHNSLTRICVRCMTEVPADAPVRAQKRKRILRTAHFLGTGPALALLAVLLVADFVGPWTPAGKLADIPIALWVAAAWSTDWVHHRLRPWCPYCPRWDGGGGIQEPSPDPVDHNQLTR
jgi:hypothetical protein